MKYLNLDMLNVYINDFNMIDRTLIKRIQFIKENQIPFEIEKALNEYESYEQINESEKPNGYKYYYKVRLENGLYTHVAFNITYSE